MAGREEGGVEVCLSAWLLSDNQEDFAKQASLQPASSSSSGQSRSCAAKLSRSRGVRGHGGSQGMNVVTSRDTQVTPPPAGLPLAFTFPCRGQVGRGVRASRAQGRGQPGPQRPRAFSRRSLLTGLYPPTSGTIIVNGKSLQTELEAVRAELGVCPQRDVLFDTLTVLEHLLLFASLKAPQGPQEELRRQVDR